PSSLLTCARFYQVFVCLKRYAPLVAGSWLHRPLHHPLFQPPTHCCSIHFEELCHLRGIEECFHSIKRKRACVMCQTDFVACVARMKYPVLRYPGTTIP